MYVFPLPNEDYEKVWKESISSSYGSYHDDAGMNVFAASNATGTSSNSTECETTVKYTVTEGYTWQVPATITFEKDAGVQKTRTQTDDVKVTQNVIAEGKTLKIKIATGEDFMIKTGTNTQLFYTVKKSGEEDALKEGGEVLAVSAGTNASTQNLTYTLNTSKSEAEIAGNYEGTLNYVASIE